MNLPSIQIKHCLSGYTCVYVSGVSNFEVGKPVRVRTGDDDDDADDDVIMIMLVVMILIMVVMMGDDGVRRW